MFLCNVKWQRSTEKQNPTLVWRGTALSSATETTLNPLTTTGHSNETELSNLKHVWGLKKQGRIFRINWSILRRAAAYTRGSKRCNLCSEEKFCVMKAEKRNILNKRSEFVSKCRHWNRCTISNTCRAKKKVICYQASHAPWQTWIKSWTISQDTS